MTNKTIVLAAILSFITLASRVANNQRGPTGPDVSYNSRNETVYAPLYRPMVEQAHNTTEQEILALEDRAWDSAMKSDFGTMADLLDDSYVGISSTGLGFGDKKTVLENYRSGKIKIVSQTFTERRVRLFGNGAIVTAVWNAEFPHEGGTSEKRAIRYTHVWVKRSTDWKIVSWQGTTVRDTRTPAPPEAGFEACSAPDVPVRPGSIEEAILKLQDEHSEATRNNDAARGSGWLADDYLGINGTGVILDKAGVMRLYRPGSLKYRVEKYGGRRVRVYGDMAILTATWCLRQQREGQLETTGANRITRVWVKSNGKWEVVTWQGTPVPAQTTETPSGDSSESSSSRSQTITENLIRNDRVHVCRITHAPRQHVRMHYAPPMTIVFLSDAHFAWLWPDGKREEVSYKSGDATWFPGGLHASESLDDHEQRMMLVVPVDDPDPGRAQGDPFIGTFMPPAAATAKPGAQSITFARDGDWQSGTLRVLTNNGEARTFAYRAKFDDQEYSYVEPTNLTNTVSLHRIDRRAFAMTERRDGKVVAVYTRVLSADGKMLTNCRWQVDGQGNETTHIEILQRESK